MVETKTTESGSHFAGDDFAGFHAKFLTKSHADSGSGLHDNLLGRIGNSLKHIADVVDEGESTHGAHLDALAAVDAAAVAEVLLESGSDDGLETTVDTAQGTDRHELVAHRLAAAAHDALVHIAVDAEGAVLTVGGGSALEGDFLDAETLGKALQLAVAVFLALETVVRVVAEDKLDDGFAGVDDAGTVGKHFHAFHHVGGAGGSQIAAAFHLDNTHAASAGFVFKIHPIKLEMAKSGNIDTGHAGSFKNRGAFGNLNRFIIYSEINHIVKSSFKY